VTPQTLIIGRFRRDLRLAAGLRIVMIATALGGLFFEKIFSGGSFLLIGAVASWVLLSYRSARGTQLAAMSPALLASGDLAAAEKVIGDALSSFCLFKSVRLRSLHHLAVLRHAQGRHAESVLYCRELLHHRLRALADLSQSARLMLADSLLHLDAVSEAGEPLASLAAEPLDLDQTLKLAAVQLEYLARLERWDQMLLGLRSRLDLVELMPPAPCAHSHALLARAASELEKGRLAEWLRMRGEAIGAETG
jgi:hypothetical protein